MSGRVAAVSQRATFDIVRERLGPRMGMANLLASMAVTLLTYVAEIGGGALALQLVSSGNYLLLVPLIAFLVWLVLWRGEGSSRGDGAGAVCGGGGGLARPPLS